MDSTNWGVEKLLRVGLLLAPQQLLHRRGHHQRADNIRRVTQLRLHRLGVNANLLKVQNNFQRNIFRLKTWSMISCRRTRRLLELWFCCDSLWSMYWWDMGSFRSLKFMRCGGALGGADFCCWCMLFIIWLVLIGCWIGVWWITWGEGGSW